MGATPFSPENKAFSDAAHAAAQREVYPFLFGCNKEDLTFDDMTDWSKDTNAMLDGKENIDKLVRVTSPNFRAPITLTAQERFRKSAWDFSDVTFTEWNEASNTPSELYKMKAQLFVYGNYNSASATMGKCVVIDVAGALVGLLRGDVRFERNTNNRSGQPFLCLSLSDLRNIGCIRWEKAAPCQP